MKSSRTWVTSMAWPSPSMIGWSRSAWRSRARRVMPPLWRRSRKRVLDQLSQADISCANRRLAGEVAVDQLVLVSSDCHGGAPWEGYRPYLGADYVERFDDWLQTKYASEAEAKRWRNAFFSEEYQ